MKNEEKHKFALDLDISEQLRWTVESYDILCDIKKLLSEYYVATFSVDGNALNVSFNNGQKFSIAVHENTKRTA